MTVKEIIAGSGVLQHVILPPEISALLDALKPAGDPEVRGPGVTIGQVVLDGDIAKSPIPGFDLLLQLPTEVVQPAPYKLRLDPPQRPTSFSFWLVLAEQGQVRALLKPICDLPELALGAARIEQEIGLTKLVRIDDKVPALVSRSKEGPELGPALLITGDAESPARFRFTPDTSSTEGVVELGLEPSTVVFGDSGVGFDCPILVLDDSDVAKASGDGAPSLDPPRSEIDADTVAWRGFLAREITFYLPPSVPFIGGRPIRGYFELPVDNGPKLVIETRVPSQPAANGAPAQPAFNVRIECFDPTARGLSGLVPTLVSATLEVPDGPVDMPIDNGSINFLRGKGLKLTATLMRDPLDVAGGFRIAISVSAQGDGGLVSVRSDQGFSAAKFFNVAAAVATALIADRKASAQSKLSAFAASGAALSTLFEDDTNFVLHGVEIESAGEVLPVGRRVRMRLDYTVQARVMALSLGELSVSMKPDMPMRIRVRGLVASIDPTASGTAMFDLDLDHIELEVEDPGAWDVTGMERLFDVLTSRSGRGSGWVEVDLRFKMNLGPVEVSDLTLRASFGGGTAPVLSLRGMAARLHVPGLLDGSGSLHLVEGGFGASIAANIVPLQLAAEADLSGGEELTFLHLGIELPAPIPLANSGFGLFAVGGLFGAPAAPDFGQEPDPILRLLGWNSHDRARYRKADGQMTVGLEAVVGTLPDFGFTLSAKAALILTVPDVSLRAALNGRVMTAPAKLDDPNVPPPGLSFLGLVNIDSDALTFALIGRLELLPLLKVTVPLVGYYPFGENAADWFTYLGTDGSPTQGRGVGPVSASVLPGILDIEADAYLMIRGRGIADWPHGRPMPTGPLTLPDGFVIAFGFGLQSSFGPKPIAWAELYACLDLLIGAKPPTLSGFGRAGGSLNLGPFSLGVEAQLAFFAQNEARFLWCEVSGKVELFFFDIEATVTISFGSDASKPTLPPPDRHPLDRETEPGGALRSTPVMTDDSYRVVAPLLERPDEIGGQTVWPDSMISIPFASMPVVEPSAADQFPGVAVTSPPPSRIGTEMLWYEWHLRGLRLVAVTEADAFAAGTPVGEGAALSARWQVDRVGGEDVAELLLFSTAGDLWMNRRTNAEGLPGDPLGESTGFCAIRVEPSQGWAVGVSASLASPGFHLPPDAVLRSPFTSRMNAQMRHYAMGATMTPLDDRTAPTNFEITPALAVDWDRPETLANHSFTGHLVAPRLDRIGRAAFAVRFEFRLQAQVFSANEPFTEGVLIIAVRPEEAGLFRDSRIRVDQDRFDESAGGSILSPTQPIEWLTEDTGEKAGDGWTVIHFKQPDGIGTRSLRILYPIGVSLAIIGLGGITVAARTAAAQREAGLQGLTGAMAAASAEGPLLRYRPYAAHRRVILEPDTLYRLDIDLAWRGQLFSQNASGVRVASGDPVTGLSYRRAGQDDVPCLRRLFFRTAPRPTGASLNRVNPRFASWLMLQQDLFEPEMIERYLAGYEPAQSEMFRFTGDPLRVHFRQNHVAALADAYGFSLSLAARRTDRAGDGDDDGPTILDLVWAWGTNRDFLGSMDRARLAKIQASPCAQPTPGATATAIAPLAPRAWYELYVVATPTGAGHPARLPGITFQTSRWRDAADMLTGLGFDTGAGVPKDIAVGDLEVAWVALSAGAASSDSGFARAIEAMGLEGWSPPERPRLSRLWTLGRNGTWNSAGLMVESIEPIIRTGRLALLPLSLEGQASDFPRQQGDGGNFRVLMLPEQPFSPAPQTHFVFSLQDIGGAIVRGRLDLPVGPPFADDPR